MESKPGAMYKSPCNVESSNGRCRYRVPIRVTLAFLLFY
jgi:hypothetical protein